jgi:hypothetical protein
MIDGYKYNIIAVSKPNNDKGAYYCFTNTYINQYDNDNIYMFISENKTIADSFVEYYNQKKSIETKKENKMPIEITTDDIGSICVVRLEKNYVEYWNR